MVRLYLDSAPIIYHVERTMPFAGAVDARLTVSGVVLVMPNSLASSVSRLRLFDHPEGTVFRNPRRPKIRVPLSAGNCEKSTRRRRSVGSRFRSGKSPTPPRCVGNALH